MKRVLDGMATICLIAVVSGCGGGTPAGSGVTAPTQSPSTAPPSYLTVGHEAAIMTIGDNIALRVKLLRLTYESQGTVGGCDARTGDVCALAKWRVLDLDQQRTDHTIPGVSWRSPSGEHRDYRYLAMSHTGRLPGLPHSLRPGEYAIGWQLYIVPDEKGFLVIQPAPTPVWVPLNPPT